MILEKTPTCVLVVDDEPLIRWSLAESLTKAGYRVLEAQDRRGALYYFQPGQNGVQLVFLDLKLPDCQDLSLLETVKRLCPSCEVILMTAYRGPGLSVDAVDRGAYRVVDKPFDMDEMVRLASEALEAPGTA